MGLSNINLIKGASWIAFIGYILIISAKFYLVVLGFGILGLGLSVIIPELFRMAGQRPAVPASVGISIVSGVGFGGFLAGPVLLGFLSNWGDLSWSFIFLGFSIIIAYCLSILTLSKRKHLN